jgi:hypothetical protein
MKPPFHQQPQSEGTHQQAQKPQGAAEFDSVEELLRHDAAQVTPPPAIAERLKDSLAKEPLKPRPWWKKLFS